MADRKTVTLTPGQLNSKDITIVGKLRYDDGSKQLKMDDNGPFIKIGEDTITIKSTPVAPSSEIVKDAAENVSTGDNLNKGIDTLNIGESGQNPPPVKTLDQAIDELLTDIDESKKETAKKAIKDAVTSTETFDTDLVVNEEGNEQPIITVTATDLNNLKALPQSGGRIRRGGRRRATKKIAKKRTTRRRRTGGRRHKTSKK
jgi:hypothetical protein